MEPIVEYELLGLSKISQAEISVGHEKNKLDIWFIGSSLQLFFLIRSHLSLEQEFEEVVSSTPVNASPLRQTCKR